MQRYTETLDIHDKNFNIRFLIEYLMKYVNNHEFYGFGGNNNMQSGYSFNQDFYDMLRKLQKEDLEKPKDISRVSETLAYYGDKGDYGNFGMLFFETLDSNGMQYQTLTNNMGRFKFPKEWEISPEGIKNNSIVLGWWHSFLKYFLEHRRSANSYVATSRNRYKESAEENERLNAIANYFLGISGQKFAEALELILGIHILKMSNSHESIEFWKSFIENPEYDVVDYLNYSKDSTKIFELLNLNFSWFFDSTYIDSYKTELSKVAFDENTKENFRKKRILTILDELLIWKNQRKDDNG
ncbi:MAG: hypothetical protein LBI43_04475 [Streptococcaceae bacterium]|jgi:hypothetical protein|nr:hypothetical protein [Streptococcaceae bacterium]